MLAESRCERQVCKAFCYSYFSLIQHVMRFNASCLDCCVDKLNSQQFLAKNANGAK